MEKKKLPVQSLAPFSDLHFFFVSHEKPSLLGGFLPFFAMGWCASKNRSPASPASQKCLREGCSYKQHTSQGHGFCCNLCKMQGDHGPLCERQHHGGAKPAAVNSGEAPKPQARTARTARTDTSKSAFFRFHLLFGETFQRPQFSGQ